MAMTEMTDKCAHAACHCPARMDSGYCGEYCKTAEDDFETGCQCGHPECQLARAETDPGLPNAD
jgi:hypothetical protein